MNKVFEKEIPPVNDDNVNFWLHYSRSRVEFAFGILEKSLYALKHEIMNRPLVTESESAPTTSTVGGIGDIRIYNSNAYILVGIADNQYQWKQMTS